MRLVIIESPYAGHVTANVAYAKRCLLDCLARGEAPIASHLLFTQSQLLDDRKPEDRQLGMEAGWAWMRVADALVVYTDNGVSSGMQRGILRASEYGLMVEHRTIEARGGK